MRFIRGIEWLTYNRYERHIDVDNACQKGVPPSFYSDFIDLHFFQVPSFYQRSNARPRLCMRVYGAAADGRLCAHARATV